MTILHALTNFQSRPLVLLDRDGTINFDHGYISDPAEIILLPRAAEGLRRLARSGRHLAIVTNQSGVGRGMFTIAKAKAVNRRLTELLKAEGVQIVATAVCYHRPDEACACRKPKDGLAVEIAAALNLSLQDAIVIGDKVSDLGFAAAIDARCILIDNLKRLHNLAETDARAGDLCGAAKLVEEWDRVSALGTGGKASCTL